MTTIDLSHLTISDQIELLYSEGIFLAKRKYEDRSVLLYQFRTTYVEIYYVRYRLQVERIVYTENTTVLDPYLDQIDLNF